MLFINILLLKLIFKYFKKKRYKINKKIHYCENNKLREKFQITL